MKTASAFILQILKREYFFVQEASQIAYGDDFVQFPNEKDLLRAHLLVELIEHYYYPPEAIAVGVYAPLFQQTAEYAEIDIIVHDSKHHPFILAAVEVLEIYEQNKDENMRTLFAAAFAMREKHAPAYLMLYTRWYEGGIRKTRQMVVDYAKFQVFSAWQRSGCPVVPDIPKNQ
jgi:hypothetical protein